MAGLENPFRPMLTVVTPAYCEAKSLPRLYERLRLALEGEDWQWIVVDDHSQDDTFKTMRDLAAKDGRVRALRLSRNSGSHIALICGIQHAEGDCVVCLSADGQDPPELIPDMLARWRQGSQVVFAARAAREHDPVATRLTARLYYAIMRRVIGMTEMPERGFDFFLLDRAVVEALGRVRERNINLLAVITWMGFRTSVLEYDRQAREEGSSKWTLAKKLKLAIDSMVSFSYLPIRMMGLIGLVTAAAGLIYVGVIIANAFLSRPAEGWSEMMAAILVLGGLQMIMLSVLGEYLWRTLDEARGRPRFLIEEATPPAEPAVVLDTMDKDGGGRG